MLRNRTRSLAVEPCGSAHLDGEVISRRSLVLGIASAATLVACGGAQTPSPSPPANQPAPSQPAPSKPAPDAEFTKIEQNLGGKIGIAALDTGSGATLHHRHDERFPMCSTFKMVLAGAVLARVDGGKEKLDRTIAYGEAALLEHAPVTRAHVKEGAMTVEALCEAIVLVSDNTAANLLLDTMGGPEGLTAYFRSLGDTVSRLDRKEVELNTAIAGDERDTTTPSAMVSTMKRLLIGDALSPASREKLLGWMIACNTGKDRLRAGLPRDWRAGDKTGTGMNGAANDVAIAWPPGRPPVLLAVYAWGSEGPLPRINAAHAEVAAVVSRFFAAG
ncbi:class A beta-lactamase [Polyangium aurulentum]|uniref:class A beta-lactamase n=1 Tax=Polyangium aurulentum TaxID=2567896 RepID=UPI0010AE43E6|nr:class A beta-lactamase [Polyangium aurulentum]UQA61818.1 class A beta-lactamase [Polyangium aurulentum]